MNWTVISESRDERTERAVTDDGIILMRSVWLASLPRIGAPRDLAFGLVAVGYDHEVRDRFMQQQSAEPVVAEPAVPDAPHHGSGVIAEAVALAGAGVGLFEALTGRREPEPPAPEPVTYAEREAADAAAHAETQQQANETNAAAAPEGEAAIPTPAPEQP